MSQVPEVIAREVARHRQDGGLERDLEAVEKQIARLADKQGRIAKRVADIEDDAVAAPLIAELRALASLKTNAEHERTALERRIADRDIEDAKVQSLTDWCRRVGANLDQLAYAERRLALEALGVQVLVYRPGAKDGAEPTQPRWTVTYRSVP